MSDTRKIEDVSELDLMTEWLKRRRAAADKTLTRSGRVEVRHVCHYAAGDLEELRTAVIRESMTSDLAIVELKNVITDLESLVGYLETGKGGFSALRERTAGHEGTSALEP